MTWRSSFSAALLLTVFGQPRPAHGEDPPPECVGDWPNPNSCFPDILCDAYAEFWDVRRAVVHIDGPDIAGTGVLINNALCDELGQGCGEGYLLTANHIVSDQMNEAMSSGERYAIENETMFTLGFESIWCGGKTVDGAIAVQGAQIIAESPVRDLLLLHLNVKLPQELGAYFVGWGKGTLRQGVAIGHPCHAPMRIAISEPEAVVFQQVVGKSIYNVEQWEIGALASGSSGSPLLDMDTHSLHGVFTHAQGAGPRICFHPDWEAEDHFTALESILDTLPVFVDGNRSAIDAYDLDSYSSLADTVEDSNYYGKGETKMIWAKEQVFLVHEFYADKGSTISIEIKP